MTLYRGVYPINFDVTRSLKDQGTFDALAELLRLGAITIGDRVIVTKGDTMGDSVGASTLQIITVSGDK